MTFALDTVLPNREQGIFEEYYYTLLLHIIIIIGQMHVAITSKLCMCALIYITYCGMIHA